MELDATQLLSLCHEAGYLAAGVCRPEIPEFDQERYLEFIQAGRHADMDWLADPERRLDPRTVFADVKGILVLATWYRDRNSEEEFNQAPYKIARYAHGRDYHKLLRKKGKRLLGAIRQTWPAVQGRIVTDSAPLLEKVYARQAGLGWQGKHTNIIHPDFGSWFFLSVLLLDHKINPGASGFQAPQADLCRDCRLCLDACPTQALEPYKLDARKCISYLNIEAKSEQSKNQLTANRSGWLFGCDICQEVCPYNRNRRSRDRTVSEEGFLLRDVIQKLMHDRDLGQSDWQQLLQGSPLARVGQSGLLYQKAILDQQAGDD